MLLDTQITKSIPNQEALCFGHSRGTPGRRSRDRSNTLLHGALNLLAFSNLSVCRRALFLVRIQFSSLCLEMMNAPLLLQDQSTPSLPRVSPFPQILKSAFPTENSQICLWVRNTRTKLKGGKRSITWWHQRKLWLNHRQPGPSKGSLLVVVSQSRMV